MNSEEPVDVILRRGLNPPYHWLTATGEVYMGTFLQVCPGAVLHRYLAVTSYDSGVHRLSHEDSAAGWQLRGDVAYSPFVSTVEALRFQRDGLDSPGYDEWYVFESSPDLGEVFHGNFFDFHPDDHRLMVFVNYFAFVLHDPEDSMPGFVDCFWKQLLRVQPETFIADGRDCLTVVTKREELIEQAMAGLGRRT